jgi:hypothetical protein
MLRLKRAIHVYVTAMHAGDYNYALERDQKKSKERPMPYARGRQAAPSERIRSNFRMLAAAIDQPVHVAHRSASPHNASNDMCKGAMLDPELSTRMEAVHHAEQQAKIPWAGKKQIIPADFSADLKLEDQAGHLVAHERRQPEASASCPQNSERGDTRAIAETHYAQGYAKRKAV